MSDTRRYAAAPRKGLGVHVDGLLRQAHRVPAVHRDAFTRAMREAREIVEIRNGVIHGVGTADVSAAAWSTQRQNRREHGGDERWLEVSYDRDLLIGAGRRARQIATLLQEVQVDLVAPHASVSVSTSDRPNHLL